MPSKPLRLLIISSTFHPVVGGAETYAFELARSLAAAGHAVAVVTDLPRGVRSVRYPGDPLGVEVYRISDYREALDDESKIPWEQMAFGLMPSLSAVVNTFEPNVLLSNSLDTALVAKMISLDRKLPWAAAFHEQAPEREPFGEGRLRLIYGDLRPSLILAGSEFYANRARRWGSAESVRLIYHGVDTEHFHPDIDGRAMRQRFGVSPDDVLIACAGRLKPRKGQLELIHAFHRIGAENARVRLVIVGSVSSASREYADELAAVAGRLSISDRVVFDESITFDSMPSVLAAADIVAQPSLEEGLGLSVIEAMASGVPVVTCDIPGVREVTTEPDVALTVPPGDVVLLAKALASLVASKDLRERLGARGRQHALRRFSRGRMVQQTEAALIELLRSAPNGSR